MIIYMSGVMKDQRVEDIMMRDRCARLCSFAYADDIEYVMEQATQRGITGLNVMLDSGAFTAWQGGNPIRLDDLMRYYARVLGTHGHLHTFSAISLDVIPGRIEKTGRTRTERVYHAPTPDEQRAAVDESLVNYRKLKAEFGDIIMPVFHTSDPHDLLESFLAEGAKYVCLSMNQAWAERERVAWALRQMPYLRNVKVHGLAATGISMMRDVAWTSVDSAAWVLRAVYGWIYLNIDNELRAVMISSRSSHVKDYGKHVDTRHDRADIEAHIRAHGFDPDELRQSTTARQAWNAHVWATTDVRQHNATQEDLFA